MTQRHIQINHCLATVELALRRSNRLEAIAAIERLFGVEPDDISDDTPIMALAQHGATIHALTILENRGVLTVGELCEMHRTQLMLIPFVSHKLVGQLEKALANVGKELRR